MIPAWAKNTGRKTGQMEIVDVDADKAYAAILDELKASPPLMMPNGDVVSLEGKPDQYWLEVVFQFIKLDLQQALGRMDFEIHILGGKDKYAQRLYPAGRGIQAATRNKEARFHWEAMRGVPIPGRARAGSRIVR